MLIWLAECGTVELPRAALLSCAPCLSKVLELDLPIHINIDGAVVLQEGMMNMYCWF